MTYYICTPQAWGEYIYICLAPPVFVVTERQTPLNMMVVFDEQQTSLTLVVLN